MKGGRAMLTNEQRTHLLAQAEYWDDEQHQTYAEAILRGEV